MARSLDETTVPSSCTAVGEASTGRRVSQHCLKLSCSCSRPCSYKQAGEESALCPSKSQRLLVEAGRSEVHISCFCISVSVNSYRLALCYRIPQKPGCSPRPDSSCQLNILQRLVMFVKYFKDMRYIVLRFLLNETVF